MMRVGKSQVQRILVITVSMSLALGGALVSRAEDQSTAILIHFDSDQQLQVESLPLGVCPRIQFTLEIWV